MQESGKMDVLVIPSRRVVPRGLSDCGARRPSSSLGRTNRTPQTRTAGSLFIRMHRRRCGVLVVHEISHGLQALTQLALVIITLVVPCGLLRR
jgi:hypothetical protein